MLKSMNNVWNARKKQKMVDEYKNKPAQEDEKKETKKRDKDEVIRAFLENTEELASRGSQTAYTLSTLLINDTTVNGEDKNRLVSGDEENIDKNVSAEDSDRETDDDNELECTQPFIEEDIYADETCNDERRDDEETEVYPSSDNGTSFYGADHVCKENQSHGKTSRERNKVANVAYSREKHSVVGPTPGQTNEQRSGEDKVTSREGSQVTQQDYLTPRVSPCRARQFDPTEVNGESITIVDPRDNVKQNTKTTQNGDDQDECVPTQPSKLRREDESVVKSCFPLKQNGKKSDEAFGEKMDYRDSFSDQVCSKP
ncbi:unnamed protein product [Peronospora destructor]|uniref:Uncharacterized protein n=1 Tax=Peronospora destructor TaxID=86335 RepID=A0AAV0U5N4_9STRA|nr:unnamed protein product [Peronospora destructor]